MCQQRDYRDYKKQKLSASQDGRGIKVTPTTSPGILVHKAIGSTATNEWDEVWIKAVNSSASAIKLTIEWGGSTDPDDLISIIVPAESSLVEIIPGHVLQGGKEIRAFAETANQVVLHGYVNRYEINQ